MALVMVLVMVPMMAAESKLSRWLIQRWYNRQQSPLLLLRPLSRLFRWIAERRRQRTEAIELAVPVVVVGNITVGGAGKTPLVIWLVEKLQARGLSVAVISRGYGGKAKTWPQTVTAASSPQWVGDEPVLIARRCGCPMVVGPDRVAAAEQLLTSSKPQLILSDDGLQHYRLGRALEIAVVDGQRGLGNRACLPAGPLREPASRLQEVDYVISNGPCADHSLQPDAVMQLASAAAVNLLTAEQRPLADFALQTSTGTALNAMAGIGNPERFFISLRNAGLSIKPLAFPDHHAYSEEDIPSGTVLMTEKDAVKCESMAHADCWYLPVSACLPEDFEAELLARIEQLAKDHRPNTATQ